MFSLDTTAAQEACERFVMCLPNGRIVKEPGCFPYVQQYLFDDEPRETDRGTWNFYFDRNGNLDGFEPTPGVQGYFWGTNVLEMFAQAIREFEESQPNALD